MRYYKEWLIERTGLFLFLILFASSGWGQTLTGTILGTITDPSGAVVPGVEVRAINTGTNQTRSVTTSGSGTYSLSNLPVGSYRLEASGPKLEPASFFRSTRALDLISRSRSEQSTRSSKWSPTRPCSRLTNPRSEA